MSLQIRKLLLKLTSNHPINNKPANCNKSNKQLQLQPKQPLNCLKKNSISLLR